METPNFECPVCLDVIKEPVSLPCGHNFCLQCMQEFSYFSKTKCPVCRRFFPSANYKINKLIEYFTHYYHLSRSSKTYELKSERVKRFHRKIMMLGGITTLFIIFLTIMLKGKAGKIREIGKKTLNAFGKIFIWIFSQII